MTEINRAKDANDWGKASALAAELKKLGGILGVLYLQPENFYEKLSRAAKSGLSDADVERLIAERRAAHRARNFKESDRIRDELTRPASSWKISPTAQRLGGGLSGAGARGNHWRRVAVFPYHSRPRVRGMAQSGSASALGAEGRGFESLCPDHSTKMCARSSAG